MAQLQVSNEERRNQIASTYGKGTAFQKSKGTAPAAKQLSKEDALVRNTIDGMIEKGEISDSLGRGYGPGSEPFKFNKTGKEIKEHLPTIIATLEAQKAVIEAQLATLLTTAAGLGVVPDSEITSSLIKTFKVANFSWKLCEAAYDDIARKYNDPTESNICCSKYNSLCWMLRDLSEDLETTKVVIANVEDDKKYNLSVSQLIALNFK